MTYNLVNFGKVQGYSIGWIELSDIIDKIYPKENLENDWYRKWTATDWTKANVNRTYLNLNYYRKFKLREQKPLGYYDNINCRYIVTDKYKKIIDVIAEYKRRNEKHG